MLFHRHHRRLRTAELLVQRRHARLRHHQSMSAQSPSRLCNGNGMHLSMGNIDEKSKDALLFVDFERQTRMRVLGNAPILK